MGGVEGSGSETYSAKLCHWGIGVRTIVLTPSLLHEVQLTLPLERPTGLSVAADEKVLFLSHAHGLTTPLRHRRRRLQLRRVPHVRDELRVAAPRNRSEEHTSELQ